MYSSKAKLAEVRREIAMRKNVYPRHWSRTARFVQRVAEQLSLKLKVV